MVNEITWRLGRKQNGYWITIHLTRLHDLLKAVLVYLKYVATEVYRNNEQDLFEAKINLFPQSYMPGAWVPTMTCPIRNL